MFTSEEVEQELKIT